MPKPRTSIFRQVLVRTDCAFWCIHDHPGPLAFLALPTLIAVILIAISLIGVYRTWGPGGWAGYEAGVIVVPFLALVVFSIFPMPCVVYAWRVAEGQTPTVGECFAECRRRFGRLVSVFLRLVPLWLVSMIFLGLPLLYFWPRTCLAPLVALFENDRRIFRRSQRILGEGHAVTFLGFLFLAMALVLAGLVALPRIVLGTGAIGLNVLDEQWLTLINDNLWILEAISGAALLTAVAVGWWISLTLLYHDVREVREGEDLRRRITELKHVLATH